MRHYNPKDMDPKEKLLIRLKKYASTEKGIRNRQKCYENAKKIGRIYAYTVVRRAIKSGKLIRTNICVLCNKEGKTHFHHHLGYSKENRLDVIEVCTKCHGREHRHHIRI